MVVVVGWLYGLFAYASLIMATWGAGGGGDNSGSASVGYNMYK